MKPLYEDTQVICYEDKLEIKRYYFPIGTSKIIPYNDIKGYEEIKMNFFNGGGRVWGMNTSPYWFNCDGNRFYKNKRINIDLGAKINPTITPDNPEKFMEIFKEKVKK
ncbi:MAG: hypothetical protein U0457_06075 [Candidatus Sericytochromatia bacterium]